MDRARRARIRSHVLWLLDEADRLDKAAADLDGKPRPAPVASVQDMTKEWVDGTLGPDQLRRSAADLRVLAANQAKQLTETNTGDSK